MNKNKDNLYEQRLELNEKIESHEKLLTDEEKNFQMGLSSKNAKKAEEVSNKLNIISVFYCKRAEINHRLEEFDNALHDLDQALSLGLHSSKAFKLMATILGELGDYEESTKYSRYASMLKTQEQEETERHPGTTEEISNKSTTSQLTKTEEPQDKTEEPSHKRQKSTDTSSVEQNQTRNDNIVFTEEQKALLASIDDQEIYQEIEQQIIQSHLDAERNNATKLPSIAPRIESGNNYFSSSHIGDDVNSLHEAVHETAPSLSGLMGDDFF